MTSNAKLTKMKKKKAELDAKAHALTSKVNKKMAEQSALATKINQLSNSLTNKDYTDAQSSYDDLQSQATKLKDKISKSKSAKTKTSLQNQLNDLLNKKATYANKMRNIANQNGFADKNNELTRLRRNADSLNKLLTSLRAQQSTAQDNATSYDSKYTAANMALVKRRNAPNIAKQVRKIRKNSSNTILYRTDMQSDQVFSLVETSPSETDSNDVATKPIDGSAVQVNWISQNNREYTGTFYLKGKSFADCDTQFKTLMDWSYQYEFTINGFSKWTHGYITSIAKSTDETISQDGMIITLTFTYARQAQIKYKRETKGKTKHKAGTKATLGSHGGKSNSYVRLKPGMTLEQVSRKTGVPLATLMKNNPGKLAANAKVRLA